MTPPPLLQWESNFRDMFPRYKAIGFNGNRYDLMFGHRGGFHCEVDNKNLASSHYTDGTQDPIAKQIYEETQDKDLTRIFNYAKFHCQRHSDRLWKVAVESVTQLF